MGFMLAHVKRLLNALARRDEPPGPYFQGRRRYLVLLDLLNRCNLGCVMCYLRRQPVPPREALPLDLFERLAEALFPLSHQVLLSCGYEPFLLPNLKEYVAIAARYGVPRLYLTTNGTLLDRAASEWLIGSGLDGLAVSLDGATAETFEAIRPGARLEALLENLRTFTRLKNERGAGEPRLQINTVVMERNLGEISLMLERTAGFEPFKYVFIHQDYTAPPAERLAPTAAVLRRALTECVRRGILYEEIPNACLSLGEILAAYGCDPAEAPQLTERCFDPGHLVRIAPNGDVWICPVIEEPAGNLVRSEFNEILDGEGCARLRERLRGGGAHPACANCPYGRRGLVQTMWARERVERTITTKTNPPKP